MLLPNSNAATRNIKSDSKNIVCGFVEPDRWATQKLSPLPFAFIDAFNPFDPNEVPVPDFIRFFACRGGFNCNQVWEVPSKGVSQIQSNMVRHLKNHFTFNPKLIAAKEEPEGKKLEKIELNFYAVG